MAVHNGEEFLKEQLNSLEQQEYTFGIDLYISLDSTSDKSHDLIKNFKFNKVNLKKIYKTNFKSSTRNFMYLLNMVTDIYDVYMFSDQDDIWYKDKLSRSNKELSRMSAVKPSLVCSRTQIIDVAGKSIGKSPLFKKKPSFKNALVQSLAGGNTMAFNHKSKELLTQVTFTNDLPSHDWFLYLLVTSYGGEVIYFQSPLVKYRKHKNNLIGPNQSLEERYTRAIQFLQGRFNKMFWANIENLEKYQLPDDKKEVLKTLRSLNSKNIGERLIYALKLNIYRQNFFASILINLSIIFRRI